MNELTAFFAGFAFALIGTLIPGVLNGMIVQQQVTYGKERAREFMYGAILTVVLQSWLAIYFASYLSIHPEIYSSLKKYGIGLLGLLAIYFLYQTLKKDKTETTTTAKPPTFQTKNNFVKGALFACLNIFPFFAYVVIGIMAEEEQWFSITPWTILTLGLGVAFASFLVLEFYRRLFQNKTKNDSWILRNIYPILFVLTLGITVNELYKMYS